MFDFEVRKKLIDERQKLLAQYMAQQQEMPQGQMVSGHYVAPSIFQSINAAITPALRQAATRSELEKMQQEYSDADRTEALNHIQSRPNALPVQQGPVDPSNPTELDAKLADPAAVAKWQQEGLQIPSRRDLVSKLMLDTELNEPIRAEARADKVQARRDTEAEAERQRIERGEQSAAERGIRDKRERDLATQRSQDLRYSTDQNNETRRMMIAAQVEKASKPTAAEQKAQLSRAEEKRQAFEVLNLLNDATALIPDATGSGMGTMADNAMAFFGKSTAGADNSARLKAIGGLLVSKMPRMEGPQSDSDRKLYEAMAGRIGDPNVPASQKLAAAETIHEINKRYSVGGLGQPAGPAAYKAGDVVRGWRFNGGDPADRRNWSMAK